MAVQSPVDGADLAAGEASSGEPKRPSQTRARSESTRRRTGRPRGRGRARPVRQCAFCVSKTAVVDYKQVDVLRPYITEQGKIRPRRQTRLCAKHQRKVARAIKRARHLALLPFTAAGRRRFPG